MMKSKMAIVAVFLVVSFCISSTHAKELASTEEMIPIGGCKILEKNNSLVLIPTLKDQSYVVTKDQFSPPFVVKAKLKTDSTNIRLYYSKGIIILNWEVRPKELRYHDLRTGRYKGIPEKGFVEPNKWHEVVWKVDKDKIKLLVDGEERFTTYGDYADLKAPIGIGPAFGSQVSLESLTVSHILPSFTAIPKSPKPHPEKYTFQFIGIEIPKGTIQNPDIDVEKMIQHPDADITEYPIVVAGFRESVTNDLTKSVSLPEDYDIVDGKAVAKEKIYKLGYCVSITVYKAMKDGSISYNLDSSLQKLVGFDENKKDGINIKMPRLKKETDDTGFVQKLNSWGMVGGFNSQRFDGKKTTQIICVRIIPPKTKGCSSLQQGLNIEWNISEGQFDIEGDSIKATGVENCIWQTTPYEDFELSFYATKAAKSDFRVNIGAPAVTTTRRHGFFYQVLIPWEGGDSRVDYFSNGRCTHIKRGFKNILKPRYHVRMMVEDGLLRVWIDNELHIDCKLPNYKKGFIGFGTMTSVRVEDIVITKVGQQDPKRKPNASRKRQWSPEKVTDGQVVDGAQQVGAKQESSPRAVALDFVKMMFLQLDTSSAIELIDADAERKNNGKGSAIAALNKQPPAGVEVLEIIFFSKKDLSAMKQRFPDDLWDEDRVSSRVDGELGCLVNLKIKGVGQGIIVFVVGKTENGHKIVYVDDQ